MIYMESAAQRKIIALLVEIKEEQHRQWEVLQDLQAWLRGQTGYEEEDVEALDVDLPLRILEQLDKMERCLEEPGIQKRMVAVPTRWNCLQCECLLWQWCWSPVQIVGVLPVADGRGYSWWCSKTSHAICAIFCCWFWAKLGGPWTEEELQEHSPPRGPLP